MKRLLSSVWNFFEVEEIFYTLFVIAVLFVIPAFAVFTIGDALTYIAFFMPVIFLAGSALYGYFVGSRRGMKRKIMHAAAIAEAVVFIPVLFI